MATFEYRAVPAPRKGKSSKGVRGAPAKFANAVSDLMNEMGAEGWEYLRADTLPCEERQGLTGKTVKYHSMLVFRRPADEATVESEDTAETLALPIPAVDEGEVVETVETLAEDAAEEADIAEETSEEQSKSDPDGDEPNRPHVAAE